MCSHHTTLSVVATLYALAVHSLCSLLFLHPLVFMQQQNSGLPVFLTNIEERVEPGLTIACLSDTHGMHRENKLKVPDADVLVFAGDAGLSSEKEMESFNDWLGTLPHEHKIIVYGNMDSGTVPLSFDAKEHLSNATVILTDSYVEIDGYVFYGSPYTPKFCGVYQLEDEISAERHWEHTMKDLPKIDVLITHGPPFGTGDMTGGRHVGDQVLANHVNTWAEAPRLWICGHVHASHGLHPYPHPQATVPLVNVAVWYLDGGVAGKAQPCLIELPSLRIWRDRELLSFASD